MEKYDVIIIGAGVTGTAVARELSRYQIKTCVLEREEDVCCGTSKANSAIIHAGYDAEPGTLKAKLNVRGNLLIGELAEKLVFHLNGMVHLCYVWTKKTIQIYRSFMKKELQMGKEASDFES